MYLQCTQRWLRIGIVLFVCKGGEKKSWGCWVGVWAGGVYFDQFLLINADVFLIYSSCVVSVYLLGLHARVFLSVRIFRLNFVCLFACLCKCVCPLMHFPSVNACHCYSKFLISISSYGLIVQAGVCLLCVSLCPATLLQSQCFSLWVNPDALSLRVQWTLQYHSCADVAILYIYWDSVVSIRITEWGLNATVPLYTHGVHWNLAVTNHFAVKTNYLALVKSLNVPLCSQQKINTCIFNQYMRRFLLYCQLSKYFCTWMSFC